MGELLALAAGVCFAIATMLAQRGMKEASVAAGVAIGLLFNNITYGVLLLVEIRAEGMPSVTGEGLLYAVGGGLIGNVLGRTLSFSAVRRIGSPRAIALSLTQTFFAFVFSVFLLREIPNLLALAGIGLLVGGVYLLTLEQVKQENSRAVMSGGQSGHDLAVVPGTGTARLLGPRTVGVIFALLAGLAYSGADLSRKLSLRSLPSAVMCSAIGGISALLVQSITFFMQGGWRELKGLSRHTLAFLIASGIINGLAVVFLNTAFSYTAIVVVTSLYNIKVWVPIVLGPLLLGAEARINKIVVVSTLLIMTGTLMIILLNN